MDSILALLQDPVAQGSIYVTVILMGMQLMKAEIIPVAWWTAHEGLLRLLPVVLGIAVHCVIDGGAAWGPLLKDGVSDGIFALGIFNGSKIVRG
jgi:hypothetical protein